MLKWGQTPSLFDVKLHFKNIALLDAHTFSEATDLIVENGIIVAKGLAPNRAQGATVYDGKNRIWATPGFINSHTHCALSFLREQAILHPNMIEEVFFKAESQLTPNDVERNARSGLLACLLSGTTTVCDHYYHISGVEKAVRKLGMRAFLAETLADLGGAKPERSDPNHFLDSEDYPNTKHQLVRRVLGPHAANTVSDDYLLEIKKISENRETPVHMHLSQTLAERDQLLARTSLSPVQHLNQLGLLGQQLQAVHLVSADEADIKTLVDTKTFVGLSPSSQILYEKLAPIGSFFQQRIRGNLGTDCAASNDSMDILAELKILYLLLKDRGYPQSAKELLKCVWDHPAAWLQTPELGSLKEGSFADLLFFELDESSDPIHDPHHHLIMTLTSRHLKHVLIDGKFVMWNRKGRA